MMIGAKGIRLSSTELKIRVERALFRNRYPAFWFHSGHLLLEELFQRPSLAQRDPRAGSHAEVPRIITLARP